jgi:hypothetical protein
MATRPAGDIECWFSVVSIAPTGAPIRSTTASPGMTVQRAKLDPSRFAPSHPQGKPKANP